MKLSQLSTGHNENIIKTIFVNDKQRRSVDTVFTVNVCVTDLGSVFPLKLHRQIKRMSEAEFMC